MNTRVCVCFISNILILNLIEYSTRAYGFGSFSQFRCRCAKNTCSTEGDCLDNGDCMNGWYGQKCQYRVMYFTYNVTGKILDNDLQTCISLKSLYFELTINIANEVLIYFQIVKVAKDDTLMDFQIYDQYEDPFLCFYKNHMNSRYVDVSCMGKKQVTHVLHFEWLNETIICEIVLLSGRSLPLRSDKQEGSLIYSEVSSYDFNIGSTTHISFQLFNDHMYYAAVICFGTENVQIRIATFVDEDIVRVITYDPNGNIQCGFTGSSQRMSKLKISYSKVDHLQAARIKTLYVYGDCEAPYYGLECDHVCSRSCYKRVCYLDGTCRACYHGWKGAQCDQEDTEAFYEIKGLITQKPWPLPPVYPPPPQPRYNSTLLGLTILLVGSVIIAVMVALTCYLKPVHIVATIDPDKVDDFIANRASRQLRVIDGLDDNETADNDDDEDDDEDVEDEDYDDEDDDEDSEDDATNTDTNSDETNTTYATNTTDATDDTEESKDSELS